MFNIELTSRGCDISDACLQSPPGSLKVAQECRGLNGCCPQWLTSRGSPGRDCAERDACWRRNPVIACSPTKFGNDRPRVVDKFH